MESPLDNSIENTPNALISEIAIAQMRKTIPWTLFLGVMFLFACVFMVLFGISSIMGADEVSSQGQDNAVRVIGGFLLAGGLLFGYGGVLLIQISLKSGNFVRTPSQGTFLSVTLLQKRFWVVMSIYAVGFIISIIATILLSLKLLALAMKNA